MNSFLSPSKQESVEIVLHEKSLLGLRLKPCYEPFSGKKKVLIGVKVVSVERVAGGTYNEMIKDHVSTGDKLSHIDDVPVNYMDYQEAVETMRSKRPIKLTFLKKASSEGFIFINKNDSGVLQNQTKESEVEADLSKYSNSELGGRVTQTDYESSINNGDIKRLQELCFFHGVPDVADESLRRKCWMVLLGRTNIAPDAENDSSSTSKENEDYERLTLDFLSERTTSRRPAFLSGQAWWEAGEEDIDLKMNSSSNDNAPTAIERVDSTSSEKSGGEKKDDRELREQIWKDVQRTYPGLHYFTQETYESLERMLFIFAKTHSKIGYIQGMNELVAPLSFVFDVKNTPSNEATCYKLFEILMINVQGMYLQQIATQDQKTSPSPHSEEKEIYAKMNAFTWLLYRHDYILFSKLHSELKIEPWFYMFRWLTTILSREFDLPDTLRLWDSVFSNYFDLKDRFDFLLYICCAMVLLQKQDLLQADFSKSLEILQNYPFVDVRILIQLATKLFEKDRADGISIDFLKNNKFQDIRNVEGDNQLLDDLQEVKEVVKQQLTGWMKTLRERFDDATTK